MGVPVVTLAGDRHASRVGVSILSAAGLLELIASSPESYVAIAKELAGDFNKLAALRASLRSRLTPSALMDARRLTRALEEAYRSTWRTWCYSVVTNS